MARINIEEKWKDDPRRGRLSNLLGQLSGKSELGPILADGCTQELWRMSQRFWQKSELIPGHVFIYVYGAMELLQSGLIRLYETPKIWNYPDVSEQHPNVPQRDPNEVKREMNDTRTRSSSVRDLNDLSNYWIYACGSREFHFWLIKGLLQRVEAGKKSAQTRKRKNGTAQPKKKASNETGSRSNDSRTTPNGPEPSSSFSLSFSPSSSLKKEEKQESITPGGVTRPPNEIHNLVVTFETKWKERYPEGVFSKTDKIYGQMKQLFQKVPHDLLPKLIPYYIDSENPFYVSNQHMPQYLLGDWEKLVAGMTAGTPHPGQLRVVHTHPITKTQMINQRNKEVLQREIERAEREEREAQNAALSN